MKLKIFEIELILPDFSVTNIWNKEKYYPAIFLSAHFKN